MSFPYQNFVNLYLFLGLFTFLQIENNGDMGKWVRNTDKYVDKIDMLYGRQINKLEDDGVPYGIPKF